MARRRPSSHFQVLKYFDIDVPEMSKGPSLKPKKPARDTPEPPKKQAKKDDEGEKAAAKTKSAETKAADKTKTNKKSEL